MISLTEKLANLPSRPGVYLMRDKGGKVVYVGKAKDLRARVRVYFNNADERSQIQFLLRRVEDIETLVTGSDKEALILENNLIKQYKPRYNIRLKDDKSYVSVKVTVTDPWPRVLVTRRIVKDGSKYFGPYASAQGVRETLDTIRKVIPLRTCSDGVFRHGKLTGNQAYSFQDFELPQEEILEALLTQFYQGERYIPDEILVPCELEDREVRAEYLGEKKETKVDILRPQRGEKVRLVEMA